VFHQHDTLFIRIFNLYISIAPAINYVPPRFSQNAAVIQPKNSIALRRVHPPGEAQMRGGLSRGNGQNSSSTSSIRRQMSAIASSALLAGGAAFSLSKKILSRS
jgi:hypothetical protein